MPSLLIDAPTTEQPTTYISDASSTDTMTTSSKSSARSNPPSEVSSSDDDDSSGTFVIIAVVVPVVLLIVLVVVVWWLCKRKKRNMQGNSSHGSSGKNNGTAGLKQFRHTDSNLRGPDAYADGQIGDTNETFGTDSQVNPGYATPDFKKREINPVNSYPEPGYETPDVKKKEVNVATADSAYSMPDKNTSENNADIERVDVNGDLYALPNKNKNTKKINGLNYMDPSRLVSGSQDGNESQDQSSQPTEYAEVVGVMKPAPKKTKTKK
ncbi:Hypothetical predicted protein [Paramuricea clavata]|uniref:Uncharacterized protein n=1 Tax=Paramuricea clavata TaxID=317549 RepID=A0A6S7K3K6_PARCT|nr:Hypothetical predicted protein [Paramuricea clavata]